MPVLELTNRELLIRSDMYALAHVYGILSIDDAVDAFNHYEERPCDRDEIIAALQKKDSQSVTPFLDLKCDRILSPIFRTFTNAGDLIDLILEKRRKFDIFYIDKNELQSYCEFTPWSPANAWEVFGDIGIDRHYLKSGNDYVSFLWQYFIYTQSEWAIDNDTTLNTTTDILPSDPSKWFMEHVIVLDDDERQTVLTLAKRMFYTTRLWTQFGRNPIDVIRANTREISQTTRDFFLKMSTDADYDLPTEPQKVVSLKIERNAPCPCGSGLKYKKCCGKSK